MENGYLQWLKKCMDICIAIDYIKNEEIESEFENLDRKYTELSELQKEKIDQFLYEKISEKEYVHIASIVIQKTKIDDLKELLLKHFLQIEYNCFEGFMIEFQISNKANIHNYYMMRQLHKKNVRLVEERLDYNCEYIPICARDKERIVIITDTLLSIYHAPTKVTMQYAYVLKKMLGYSVDILVCPLNKKIDYDWYQQIFMNSPREILSSKKHFRVQYEDVNIDVYQFNMDGNCEREYRSLLRYVEISKPLFIFELGVSNPIADVTKLLTTTIAMNMTINLPVSNADYLIKLGNKIDDQEYIDSNQKIIFKGDTHKYFEISEKSYQRSEFGLKDDEFLIAIVGNRLDIEIDNEFIQVLRKLQDDNNNIVYLIIGECNNLKNKFKMLQVNKAIFMGFREDLMEIYSMIDVYLNPKRIGGGYSGLMAITAQVPVVTMPDCDVAYNVGDEFVVNDYNEMIETINRYIHDKDFYKKKKAMTMQVGENNTKKKMYESICNELKRIINVIKSDFYK